MTIWSDSQHYPQKVCQRFLKKCFFYFLKLIIFMVSLQKWFAHFYCRKNYQELEWNSFKPRKTTISSTLYSNKGSKEPLWIGIFHLCIEGHFKLRLQSLLLQSWINWKRFLVFNYIKSLKSWKDNLFLN